MSLEEEEEVVHTLEVVEYTGIIDALWRSLGTQEPQFPGDYDALFVRLSNLYSEFLNGPEDRESRMGDLFKFFSRHAMTCGGCMRHLKYCFFATRKCSQLLGVPIPEADSSAPALVHNHAPFDLVVFVVPQILCDSQLDLIIRNDFNLGVMEGCGCAKLLSHIKAQKGWRVVSDVTRMMGRDEEIAVFYSILLLEMIIESEMIKKKSKQFFYRTLVSDDPKARCMESTALEALATTGETLSQLYGKFVTGAKVPNSPGIAKVVYGLMDDFYFEKMKNIIGVGAVSNSGNPAAAVGFTSTSTTTKIDWNSNGTNCHLPSIALKRVHGTNPFAGGISAMGHSLSFFRDNHMIGPISIYPKS